MNCRTVLSSRFVQGEPSGLTDTTDQTVGDMPMTAQEYLIRAYHYRLLIRSKREQLSLLMDMLTNITVPTDREPTGGTRKTQTMESLIASVTDLENELRNDEGNFARYEVETISLINKLVGYKERRVMTLRYVRYMDWNEIAGAMTLSIRRVQTIHRDALDRLTGIMRRDKIVANVEDRKDREPYIRFEKGVI